MKILILLLCLTLSFASGVSAQALLAQGSTDKFPGENTTISWNFVAADEPKISGFRIYSSPIQAGPFSNLVTSTATVSTRFLIFPAAFSVGTVRTFYVVRTYFTNAGGTVESDNSNAVEVELRVPGATGVQVD